MTNPSPPESNKPLRERRKRPATGVTFDEMIAIIVAFTTIGSILFWSLGLKNNKLAGNFGLNGRGNLLTANDKTTDTGLGLGNILGSSSDNVKIDDVDGKGSFTSRLNSGQSDQDNSLVASADSANQSGNNARGSSGFKTGAKLAPLAGAATLPAWKGRQGQRNLGLNAPNRGKPGGNGNKNQGQKSEDAGNDQAPVEATKTPPQEATKVPPQEAAQAPSQKATTPPAVEKPASPKKTAIPKDVAPTYWAYPFVKQMNDKSLLPEFSQKQNFDPDGLITRGGMATLLSQAFSTMPDVNNTKRFLDVEDNSKLTKSINKAVSTGFMKGYSELQFRPEENIPRYQVLVTLAAGLGLKPSHNADQILQKFGDSAQMPDWAKEQVAAAAEAGLVVNPPNSKGKSLIPDQAATRGEVAAMIHQALVNQGVVQPLESEFIVKP